MKQLLTLVLALFIISLSTLEARTYIRDGENVSGSWRKSKSPYIIKGEAIVPKGKTLTIEPGVEVQLKTGDVRSFDDDEFDMGYLRVRGTIKAKGSATRPIKFTRWGSYGNWGAIYLINSKGYNTFKNCIFEHAYGLHDEPECDGWSYGGQLSAFGSSGTVINCTFANEKESATYFIESSFRFVNCIFEGDIGQFGDENTIEISYSAFKNSDDDYKGNNNIMERSLYMNADYSLQASSPCVGSGKNDANMGAVGSADNDDDGESGGGTIISDGASISGRWTKSRSPYIIQGEATVRAGRTLTIEPGVVVKLKTDQKGIIYVEGKIQAEGTADDWIEFTKDGSSGTWGAILLRNTQYGNAFKYCKLSYSTYISPKFEGANSYYRGLSFHNASASVANCIFYRNKEIHLQCSNGSSPTFTNLTIVHNGYNPAIYTTDKDSRPVVKNCIVYKNDRSIGGSSNPIISYSLIGDKKSDLFSGVTIGNGMIYERDPQFVNIDADDYRLSSGSPCIGAGEYGKDLGAIPYNGSRRDDDGGGGNGPTYIRDGASISGRWTKAGSPYIVQGEATVPNGSTLTIEPGVVVKLKTDQKGIIYVEGKIQAEGTADDWIEFTRDGSDDFWGAILLKDSQYGNSFKYCKLSYSAYISPKFEGANLYYRGLSFHNSSATVSYCIFYRNKEIQLQCTKGSNPTFSNLTIVHNDYNPAIYSTDDESRPDVSDCIIYKNERSFGGTTRADVSYSLIGDEKSSLSSKVTPGRGMIYNTNPMFEDIDADDFRLKSGSPCIGVGKYGGDLGALPYRSSGGDDAGGKKKKNTGTTGSTDGN